MGSLKKLYGWYITDKEWLPVQVDSEGKIVMSELVLHANKHEDGGIDEVNIASLSGEPLDTVNKTGAQTLSGVKTFSDVPKIDILPTEDNHAVNKKYVDDEIGGIVIKEKRVVAFKTNGTWTVPAGVDYAIAHMRGGGGGAGTAASGTGGTSSVAFTDGIVSALGGLGMNINASFVEGVVANAGQVNSGMGASISGYDTLANTVGLGVGSSNHGALIVAGDVVIPAEEIAVIVGAAGAAGANGAVGGSGYVWIEYYITV